METDKPQGDDKGKEKKYQRPVTIKRGGRTLIKTSNGYIGID